MTVTDTTPKRGSAQDLSICSSVFMTMFFWEEAKLADLSILNVMWSPTSHYVPCLYCINVPLSLTYFSSAAAAEMGQITHTVLKGNTVIAAKPYESCFPNFTSARTSKHIYNSMWLMYVMYCRKQMCKWQQQKHLWQWACGIRANTA